LFEQLEHERRKFFQLFTERPGLSQKYLVISVILGMLSIIMSGWLKTFYLFLALVNLALALYTYYRHLPMPEEEKVIVEDLW
jgi:disulfide bond formation protein DsbB